MTEHYAVTDHWDAGQAVLTVHIRADGHEIFGDQIEAASVEDVPAAANARLAQAGWLRVVGAWRRDGSRWRADVEIIVG